MDRDAFKANTTVFSPIEDVYEFLGDFRSYTEYTEYVDEIRRRGDGTVGTIYDITFRKRILAIPLSYTARSRVTALDRPTSIEWEIIKDLRANGEWALEVVDEADLDVSRPSYVDPDVPATRVTIGVELNPKTIDRSAIPVPLTKSVEWLVSKVYPFIVDEARRVLSRVVTDLEGRTREPNIQFTQASGIFTRFEDSFARQ